MSKLKEYIPTIKIILALFLLIVVVIVAIQNSGAISFRFLIWSTPPINFSIVIFSTLFSVFIICLLLYFINVRKII
jgi:hypothetical protein